MRKVKPPSLWTLWLGVLIAYIAMILLIIYVNTAGPH